MKTSPIHEAARRIASTLREMDVPFAIAGALAANAHGHVRTTEDVNILITSDGLRAFKKEWLGRGWVEKFEGSKGVRDAQCNVNIDFVLTGDFPGDGKPKPVAFPPPSECSEPDEDGIPVIALPRLLELKLASGMTAPHRLQDLADVVQLIRRNDLPRDYADRLAPYVRAKFGELWQAAQVRDEE